MKDYGAGAAGNRKLQMLMYSLARTGTILCPCDVGDVYDSYEFDFEAEAEGGAAAEADAEPKDNAAIREQFLVFYKNITGLEECKGEECEFPDGHDAADVYYDGSDVDCYYNQALIDRDEYYWTLGTPANPIKKTQEEYY